ncbi:DNA-directed DNA polymerase mu-like protein [Corchorus capsularis]|uniref:DNA-directed DNA polymerase mu-like protein n=1 Tax=Corchorus capsularis TaxID=210143 RepID=A0A1R3HRW5_COCAP|nr:DNA-directed DNA polymerase mu-like protein [Corchorus capsularis]
MQGQGKGKCGDGESSGSAPSSKRAKIGVEGEATSLWSCPSNCSGAERYGGASNKTLAALRELKGWMPCNVKLNPPGCADCRLIGFGKLGELFAASNPVPVPPMPPLEAYARATLASFTLNRNFTDYTVTWASSGSGTTVVPEDEASSCISEAEDIKNDKTLEADGEVDSAGFKL